MPRKPNPERQRSNIILDGRRTSLAIEAPFWDAVRDYSTAKQIPRDDAIKVFRDMHPDLPLSSAVRVGCLEWLQSRLRRTPR